MKGIYTETSTWIWTASGGWQVGAAIMCALIGILLLMGAMVTFGDGFAKLGQPSKRRKVVAAAVLVLALGCGAAAPILDHAAPRETQQETSTKIVAAGRMVIMGQNVEGYDLRIRIAESPHYLLVLKDREDVARLLGRQNVEVRLNCDEGLFRGELQCRGEEPTRPPKASLSSVFGMSEAIPKDATLKSTCSATYTGIRMSCAG